MKTLDEVIEAVEYCEKALFTEVGCEECPYYQEPDCLLQSDVLTYLKMYRSDRMIYEADRKAWQEKLESVEAARRRYIYAVKDLQQNEPLTWAEVKGMTGQPVWFEVIKRDALPALTPSGWGIVACWSYKTWEGVECLSLVRPGVTYAMPVAEYGKVWQLYRKEKTE